MEQPEIENIKIEKMPTGQLLNWAEFLYKYENIEGDEEAEKKAKRSELIDRFYNLYLKELKKGKEISFEFSETSNLGEIRKFLGDIIREKIGDPNLDDVEVIVGELIGNLIRHGEGKGGNIILKLSPDRFYFAVRNKAENLFEKSKDGDLNFKARNEEEKSKIEKINEDIHICFYISNIEISEGAAGGKIEKYVFISKVKNYEYSGLTELKDDLNLEKLSEEEKKTKQQEINEALKKIEDRGQGIGLSACLMNKSDEFIIIVERNAKGISEWVTMGINRDRNPSTEHNIE